MALEKKPNKGAGVIPERAVALASVPLISQHSPAANTPQQPSTWRSSADGTCPQILLSCLSQGLAMQSRLTDLRLTV